MSGQDYAIVQPFERDNRFFIRAFLLDASTNQNNWGVTPEALRNYIGTFKGKPFVVTPEFDHPDEKVQEQYRKGTILDAGIDARTNRAFADIEITDKPTEELIKKGELQFVSPSLGADDRDVEKSFNASTGQTTLKVSRFVGFHLAGVKKPAFGVLKAQIKGQCSGSEHECRRQLLTVQACAGCGTFHKDDIVSSSQNEQPDKTHQMGNDSPPAAVDYTAQIEALKTNYETQIVALRAEVEAAKKRPFVERILSAKLELGMIKAEETATEAETVGKLDASNLGILANQFEAAVKTKKETQALVAQTSKGFKFKASASGAQSDKVDERKMMSIINGGAY